MLRSLAAAGKVNWASNVRSHTYGFGYVWEADTPGDGIQFIIKHGIKYCFVQQLHSHTKESSKALYYKHFKLILEVACYLNIDLSFLLID